MNLVKVDNGLPWRALALSRDKVLEPSLGMGMVPWPGMELGSCDSKLGPEVIEIQSKYTKADILLVRIAALENSPDAIEQYDNLLKKSGIVLSDEERNESIRLKGNVNGTYVRIGPDNSTIDACKIVGAEDLLIKRQILQEKAIEEAKAKFAKEI